MAERNVLSNERLGEIALLYLRWKLRQDSPYTPNSAMHSMVCVSTANGCRISYDEAEIFLRDILADPFISLDDEIIGLKNKISHTAR